MKPFQTRGAKVLVTGASSGIGNATAVALEKAGAHIALAARRLDRVQELRATFQFPGEHLPIGMDVTDPASVTSGFREIATRFGKLDGIVANAGVGGWHSVADVPEEEMKRTIETNLYGVVRCIQAGVPLLKKAGGGTIVIVSSVVGRRGVPGMGIYSASKFAVMGLADAARIELAKDNIQVSVICPGLTQTEFHKAATGDKGSPPPASEGDKPETVAAAIVQLLQTGAPEKHLLGPFSPKRWAGVITQFAPRLMDGQLVKYYEQRRSQK